MKNDRKSNLPKLPYRDAVELNRRMLIDQLYDEWRGHYVVIERDGDRLLGERNPGSKVSKRAAIAWRNPDPGRFSLGIVLPQ